MIETLTFELQPTDDVELNCLVCNRPKCDREIFARITGLGQRRSVAWGLHGACLIEPRSELPAPHLPPDAPGANARTTEAVNRQKHRLIQLEEALRWAISVIDDGVPEAPDHSCNSESQCDADCMDYAYFADDMRAARSLLSSTGEARFQGARTWVAEAHAETFRRLAGTVAVDREDLSALLHLAKLASVFVELHALEQGDESDAVEDTQGRPVASTLKGLITKIRSQLPEEKT